MDIFNKMGVPEEVGSVCKQGYKQLEPIFIGYHLNTIHLNLLKDF